MKKSFLASLLAIVCLLSLTACGGEKTDTATPSAPEQSEPVLDEQPAPEAEEVCYLPVRIVNCTDIPQEAEERLGTGSFEETVASYEYDEAGRLLRYATGSNILTFQYLDEIALPAVWEADVWESGEWEEMLAFKDPRWSADRSEIWLDVAYSDAFKGNFYDTEHAYVTADICLSDLQLDEAGRLTAASATWDTMLGGEVWPLAGCTFDERGNLQFVPLDHETFTCQYAPDGQMNGIVYGETYEGQTTPQTTVRVDEDAISVEMGSELGMNYTFASVGDGHYRDTRDDRWYELVLDEDGKLIQSAWHAESSGITYSYTIEYITVPRAQYVGTPVDYTSLCPVLMYEELFLTNSFAEAAGELQLPVTAQLILSFWQ